jgi:hypothetical protein
MFVEYLYTRTLVIDVWDGDSLFHIGCTYLPLQQLLRQGYSRLEKQLVCELTEIPLLGSGSVTTSISHLCIINGVPECLCWNRMVYRHQH